MELTQNVQLMFWTEDSVLTKDIEDALKSLPVKVEFSDLARYGDKPRLVATAVNGVGSEVILRPYQCHIWKISPGEGVRGIRKYGDLSRTVAYQGRRFNIFNMPLWK